MYLCRNFSMLRPFAFVTSLWVGNFEKRSIHARKFTSLPCPSSIGAPKSSWNSLFGSEHGGRGAQLNFRVIHFRFLQSSVQGWHVSDLFIRSRLMHRYHSRWPCSVVPQAPECVEWSMSMTDSLGAFGMANFLSRSMQPVFTLRLLHFA